MKQKQAKPTTPATPKGKAPSDRSQASRTAANKAKHLREAPGNSLTPAKNQVTAYTLDYKGMYQQRGAHEDQFKRQPVDVVSLFKLETRANLR